MRDVTTALIANLEAGLPVALCEVLDTRGSTPQKAGAKMLVHGDGTQAGTLGGGCVEAEVRRRALHVLAAGEPAQVFTFDLDGDYGWDDGLICGGRMAVLVTAFAPPDRGPAAGYFRHLTRMIDAGDGCVEAAVTTTGPGRAVGSRYLLTLAGKLVAQLGPDVPLAELGALVEGSGRAKPRRVPGWAALRTEPRVTVLIVGGGHVGQAVAALAATVDFAVWVIDDRESVISAARFPTAARRIAGPIGATLAELAPLLGPRFYGVIVTRGHNHDEEALFHLARTGAGYVGMIGSKRKVRLITDDLLLKGVTPGQLAGVRAPIGLDIGSRTVPEIAISIVGELVARRNTGAAQCGRPKA